MYKDDIYLVDQEYFQFSLEGLPNQIPKSRMGLDGKRWFTMTDPPTDRPTDRHGHREVTIPITCLIQTLAIGYWS